MAETIHLCVITPQRMLIDLDVDRVEVPGSDGELGILPSHTDLISELKTSGILTYHVNEQSFSLLICDGFVEVGPRRVTVLADYAVLPQDIDLNKAIESKNLAERSLSRLDTQDESVISSWLNDLQRSDLEIELSKKIT